MRDVLPGWFISVDPQVKLRRNHDVLTGWYVSICSPRPIDKIQAMRLGEFLLIPSWSCVGMILFQAGPFLSIPIWSSRDIPRLGLWQVGVSTRQYLGENFQSGSKDQCNNPGSK